MKTQISLRVSDATLEKLEYLAKIHGTKTEAVAVAIEVLHRNTIEEDIRQEQAKWRREVDELLKESARINAE